jgi:hypothetical protein
MSSQSPNALMTELRLILKKPLAFFIYDSFAKVYPKTASAEMGKVLKDNHNAKLAQKEIPDVFTKRDLFAEKIDIHGLLVLIEHGWAGVFANNYPDSMREDARFLLPKRHASSHDKLFSLQDIQEVAQTAKNLLNEMKTTEANEAITKIRQLLRHDYYRHIPLANHYISRPDLLEAIQTELLQPTAPILALHGMGGIGKSVLLRALCDEQAIQTRFADGILWMSFGREAHEAQLAQKLRAWIKALNGTTHDVESELDALKNWLAELLKNQACLLILDDVWTKEQLETFRVAGVNCRIIFSTRDAEIARETGAKIIPVSVMNEPLAIELLEMWSQGKLESEPKRYKELIIETLGALPLAIKLAGAQLQTKQAKDWLKTFDARKLKSSRPTENAIHDNLEDTFALSLDALKPNERRLYTAIAIFPTDAVPEQAILRLWGGLGHLDPETSKELVTDLAARALCDVTVNSDSGARAIVLHPLLRSFLYSDLDGADRQNFHLALLFAYEHIKTEAGWHTVPDDGYFYQYFPFHLKQAGQDNLLRQILLDYDFIQTILIATSEVDYLHSDYYLLRDPILQLVQHAIHQSELILTHFPEQLAECLYTQLMLLRDLPDIDALLNACYHATSPKLFPVQSQFRAVGGSFFYPSGKPETAIWYGGEELNEEAKDHLRTNFAFLNSKEVMAQVLKGMQASEAESPSYPVDPRPFSYLDGFHMPSHWFSSNIQYGHRADVNLIALSGDFALSPGNITTQSETGDFVTKAAIKIFNWKTGDWVGIVYTGEVNALVVSGDFALTTSNDGTIKVWHWRTKEEIRTLTEGRELFSHLALWEDFVAANSEKTVTVWNWQTGEEICTFTEDEDSYIDALLFEDVIVFVTTKHFIHVWNWRTRSALYSLENPQDTILSTILKEEWVFYLVENQSLKIANWRTKELICTIQEFSGQILQVVGDTRLLSALGNQLLLWNLRTGELITSIYAGDLYAPHEDMPDDSIQNALVTPNFERFIVGNQEGEILFFQPNPALQAILEENN